jgi:hypothetical protein
MGLQVAPGYIGTSGFQTPVELDRNWLAAVAGRRTGSMRYNDFALTPSASAMQLTIGAGDAVIMGSEGSTTQGGYYAWSNASEVITMPTAAGNPRYDTLLLRVIDTQYGADAAGNKALWDVASGVAAASPTPLADSQFNIGGALHRPGGWYRVADILVPASVTNLSTATVVNKRRYARLGRNVLCLSTDLPTDAQIGDIATLIDDNMNVLTWNGTQWLSVRAAGTWQPLTPYYGASVTANAFGYAPAYKLIGNTVRMRGIVFKAAGFTNGASMLSLPGSLRPAQIVEFEAATSLIAGANFTSRIDINPTGAVTSAFAQVNATAFAPTWISLDGIEYDLT